MNQSKDAEWDSSNLLDVLHHALALADAGDAVVAAYVAMAIDRLRLAVVK